MSLTLADVHAARTRRLSHAQADAASSASAARCEDGAHDSRQAREPQPDGRVQGAWGLEPHREPEPGRTAWCDHGDDRQSRTVDCARLSARGRAVHDCRSARQQPRQERRHARARRRGRGVRARLRSGARARRGAAARQRAALRALGERTAAHCRGRDLRARDLRRAARRGCRARADRRRERGLRLRPRALVARVRRPRSSASRPPVPMRSRAHGGAARA